MYTRAIYWFSILYKSKAKLYIRIVTYNSSKGSYKMSSIQISKLGVFSVNIPIRLARSLKLQKGEEARVVKGKSSNEILIIIERD